MVIPPDFIASWQLRDLRKGDMLLVPMPSAARKKVWAYPRLPLWDDRTNSEPWWLLKRHTVLHVRGPIESFRGTRWIPVQFQDGPPAWIRATHATTCACKPSPRPKRTSKNRPQPLPLSKLRQGIVVEYKGAWAVVESWITNRLPEPSYAALVRIENEHGLKDVWLQELNLST